MMAEKTEPDFSEHEPEVKDHLELDIRTQCAYCGHTFEIDEVVIEKEIHGRKWKFCNTVCLENFNDALDFRDDADDDDDADKPRS